MKKLIFSLLISLLLTFTLTACTEDREYIYWTASEDGKEITDGTTVYKEYKDLPLNFRFSSGVTYDKRATIRNRFTSIYSSTLESGIKYCHYSGGYTAYVADGADTSALDEFLSGTPTTARIYQYGRGYKDLDFAEVERLDNLSADPINIEVRALQDLDETTIYYFNSDNSLFYAHGVIYEYESKYYYINLDKLDNSYFTASGDLAHFRGIVEMFPLGDEYADELMNYYEQSDNIYVPNSESDTDLINSEAENISVTEARKDVIITLVVVNLVPSLALFCYGLFDLIKKKNRKNIYAYIIISSAILWFICGAMLIILTL